MINQKFRFISKSDSIKFAEQENKKSAEIEMNFYIGQVVYLVENNAIIKRTITKILITIEIDDSGYRKEIKYILNNENEKPYLEDILYVKLNDIPVINDRNKNKKLIDISEKKDPSYKEFELDCKIDNFL